MTIKEAAAALQVSRSTIYRWAEENRITLIRKGPAYKHRNPVFVRAEDVERLKAMGQIG